MHLYVWALVAFVSMTDQWGGHHHTARVMRIYDNKNVCEMFAKIEERGVNKPGYTFRCLRRTAWGD